MKRIKALPLLIVAAMVAMAIAAPVSALAVQWRHNGAALKEPATIELDGQAEINAAGTGVLCPVHSKATLFPGTKGEITELDVDGTAKTGTCVAFGSTLEGCLVTGAGNPPISIEAQSDGSILIKKTFSPLGSQLFTWNFEKNPFSSGQCFWAEDYWKVKGNMTATPDNRYAIHSLAIAQVMEMEVKSGGKFTRWLTMNLAVTPSGFYSIE
jgi:hypothetical protein